MPVLFFFSQNNMRPAPDNPRSSENYIYNLCKHIAIVFTLFCIIIFIL